ncbi:MAG TPA: ergothioneine biosynthesis protein EgtC [Acidimicrobiales bacterium]|jgi:glutamine amidotransferase
MCRHLAYVGPPVTLSSLLYEPSHSLARQSWAPRQQEHGTVNADGYGVGWYAPELTGEPARYRRRGPIWADRSLPSMARAIRSGAVVAAVRSATPPAPSEESGAAPFASGPWLWSLNGAVAGNLEELRRSVSVGRGGQIEGSSDAEVLFALVLDRLDGGADPATALTWLVASVPGRLNVLLADGQRIWATRMGDTLWWRRWGGGVVVGSEPFDDEPGWVVIPDRSVVSSAGATCSVTTLRTQGA